MRIRMPASDAFKRGCHDYRYFPDPDLVAIEISDKWIEEVRADLPELPQISVNVMFLSLVWQNMKQT
jgi:Asp-tRNA(Asn)/Glu-tRNA(Gln) amidotransferase B subunit